MDMEWVAAVLWRLGKGHYVAVAWIQEHNQWVEAEDSRVTLIAHSQAETEVVTSRYIFLYRQLMGPSWLTIKGFLGWHQGGGLGTTKWWTGHYKISRNPPHSSSRL